MDAHDEAIVGREGLTTLALALAVALGSCGLAPLAALIAVARRSLAAPPLPPRCGQALVLGARLPASGVPGRVFRARLARAAALHQSFPTARIVILGGARAPGAVTEAEAGRAWLIAAGVPAAAIETETRSRHTLENLRCYRAAPADAAGPVVLVTSRTHLARSVAMARGLGLSVIPCAAETSRLAAFHPWTWPREAMLLLWYAVGSRFAALTGNRAMLTRIR